MPAANADGWATARSFSWIARACGGWAGSRSSPSGRGSSARWNSCVPTRGYWRRGDETPKDRGGVRHTVVPDSGQDDAPGRGALLLAEIAGLRGRGRPHRGPAGADRAAVSSGGGTRHAGISERVGGRGGDAVRGGTPRVAGRDGIRRRRVGSAWWDGTGQRTIGQSYLEFRGERRAAGGRPRAGRRYSSRDLVAGGTGAGHGGRPLQHGAACGGGDDGGIEGRTEAPRGCDNRSLTVAARIAARIGASGSDAKSR